MSLSVIISLAASLVLSFTLVPVLFKYLMSSQQHADHAGGSANAPAQPVQHRRNNPVRVIHRRFEQGFERFREAYRNALCWAVDKPLITAAFS